MGKVERLVDRLRDYPRDRDGNFDKLTYLLDGNEAADRIEALEAELVASRESGHDSFKLACMWQEQAKTAESRLSEMEKEVERLRTWKAEALEALEPFSEAASEWDAEPAELHVFFEWNDEKKPVPSLPVADFRAARRLVEGGGDERPV